MFRKKNIRKDNGIHYQCFQTDIMNIFDRLKFSYLPISTSSLWSLNRNFSIGKDKDSGGNFK